MLTGNLIYRTEELAEVELSDEQLRELQELLPDKDGPLPTVTDKPAAAPGGTRNDYWSVGPYWWPDPNKPDGLPYIRRDGETNPDYNSGKFDRIRLESLNAELFPLAVSSSFKRLSDSSLVDRATAMLRCWFIDPKTRMNPNMRFAQSIPGICDGRGIGLIDTVALIGVAESVLILNRTGALSAEENRPVVQWYGDFLDWILTHPFGLQERAEHNNHGTWCDAQIVCYALFAGRKQIAADAIREVPGRRIDPHILPDGSQPHELKRTKSFSYSCYNLDGLFTLAWMGRRVGVDLFNYVSLDGRSLRKAIDFLLPFADPELPWPYQQLASTTGESVRAPLYPLLRQAAVAYNDPKYSAAADTCRPPSAVLTDLVWR